MNELALFAGVGGGILGGRLLGWRTVCAVEYDSYAASVLVARQNDGTLEPFPIWDDVCTFDGYPWRGTVDVISGGFPCQDISVAGNGAGLAGKRSGLWSEFARIIGEVRPPWVFIENSPMLRTRGLDVVLRDLHALGYDACWGVLGADAPAVAFGGGEVAVTHNRDRMWIVARANFDGMRELQSQGREQDERRWFGDMGQGADADAGCERGPRLREQVGSSSQVRQRGQDPAPACNSWWSRDPSDGAGGFEPRVGRVADGVANRVDRLKCIGNGQVPAVAALAWTVLSRRLLGED